MNAGLLTTRRKGLNLHGVWNMVLTQMKGPAMTELKSRIRTDLEQAINRACAENGSDTPDFILAEYLMGCLVVFDDAVKAREKWYGREPRPVVINLTE